MSGGQTQQQIKQGPIQPVKDGGQDIGRLPKADPHVIVKDLPVRQFKVEVEINSSEAQRLNQTYGVTLTNHSANANTANYNSMHAATAKDLADTLVNILRLSGYPDKEIAKVGLLVSDGRGGYKVETDPEKLIGKLKNGRYNFKDPNGTIDKFLRTYAPTDADKEKDSGVNFVHARNSCGGQLNKELKQARLLLEGLLKLRKESGAPNVSIPPFIPKYEDAIDLIGENGTPVTSVTRGQATPTQAIEPESGPLARNPVKKLNPLPFILGVISGWGPVKDCIECIKGCPDTGFKIPASGPVNTP
jgi:hypothetical protein